MENNDINELNEKSPAGSGEFERERVGNLQEDWHKADTRPFAARSKPYAEIRRTLVEGIRGSDKPAPVKHAAEVLISTIDHIHAHGEDDDSRRAFHQNYARLMQVAGPQ